MSRLSGARRLAVACAAAALAALAVSPLIAQNPGQGSGQVGVGAPAASAQGLQPAVPTMSDSALDAQTHEIASQLRCPVCQGVSIDASPTDLAREMKGLVRDQLAAGRTPQQVKDYFVSKYGEWILLQPKAKGFNLTVYLLPFAVLLIGAGVIVVAVRRWTRGAGEEVEPGAEEADRPVGTASGSER